MGEWVENRTAGGGKRAVINQSRDIGWRMAIFFLLKRINAPFEGVPLSAWNLASMFRLIKPKTWSSRYQNASSSACRRLTCHVPAYYVIFFSSSTRIYLLVLIFSIALCHSITLSLVYFLHLYQVWWFVAEFWNIIDHWPLYCSDIMRMLTSVTLVVCLNFMFSFIVSLCFSQMASLMHLWSF